jgi:hypothetical protein
MVWEAGDDRQDGHFEQHLFRVLIRGPDVGSAVAFL